MSLYQVHINDLIVAVKGNANGIMIGTIDVTCPAHADDIAVLTLYKPGLNKLLEISYVHSVK